MGLEAGLKAKAVQIRRAGGELEGAGRPPARDFGRDRRIERDSSITGEHVDVAGVPGLADGPEREHQSGEKKNEGGGSGGIHGAGALCRREYRISRRYR